MGCSDQPLRSGGGSTFRTGSKAQCFPAWRLRAAGQTVHIDPEMARLTHGQVGSAAGGKLSFEPYYELIVAEQPDLLD